MKRIICMMLVLAGWIGAQPAISNEKAHQIMSQSGRTLDGPFPADYRLYNPDIPGHRFDPERARQLLTKTGWTDPDKNGILDKGGETFREKLNGTKIGNISKKLRRISCRNL